MMKNAILSGLICLIVMPLMAQENNEIPWQKEHKGVDFKFKAGYGIGLGDAKGADMIDLGVSVGKRFDDMYFGLGTGMFNGTSSGSEPVIPITADWETFWGKGRIVPTALLRIGYGINTADDIKIGKEKIKVPNCLITQVMTGIRLGVTRSVDLDLSAGLLGLTAVGGSPGTSGTNVYLSIGGSLNFHKSTNPKPKKPKKPTRERGLQLTMEVGENGFNDDGKTYSGFNFATVVTYKFNHNLSAGIGVGCEFLDGMDIRGGYLNYASDASRPSSAGMWSSLDNAAKIFVRGQYNFTKKRFSPFVACDAGLRMYQYESNVDISDEAQSAIGKPSSSAMYMEPSLGFSLRTTNNSYIELKAGYALAPNISGSASEFKDETGYRASYRSSLKTSAPFVSLGFRHTFGLGGKWFK